MRVAYHSPMPPSTSGIADYSALLVPALREVIEVDVVAGGDQRGAAADVALYQIGNSAEEHGWIVEALRQRPGIIVLHEYALHHLIAGITIARGDTEGYLSAMQRDAGVVGRLVAHGVADGVIRPVWETRGPDFPLVGEILDHATAVIAHSDTVEQAIRRRGYAGPVHRIPHPAWPVPDGPEDAVVAALEGPVFGVFGHVNAAKRIPEILEAHRRLRERGTAATLVLAGGASEAGVGPDAGALGDGVVRLPYVDEERLWALIRSVDAVLNLRHPTMGETSGIAVRALSAGTPLVVSDVGWFAELPDDVAFKVPVGDGEVDAIVAVMEAIARDPSAAAEHGAAGARLAREEMAVGHVAELYRRAIVDADGGEQIRARVVGEVGAAAAAVGLAPDDQDRVGRRMRESGL